MMARISLVVVFVPSKGVALVPDLALSCLYFDFLFGRGICKQVQDIWTIISFQEMKHLQKLPKEVSV